MPLTRYAPLLALLLLGGAWSAPNHSMTPTAVLVHSSDISSGANHYLPAGGPLTTTAPADNMANGGWALEICIIVNDDPGSGNVWIAEIFVNGSEPAGGDSANIVFGGQGVAVCTIQQPPMRFEAGDGVHCHLNGVSAPSPTSGATCWIYIRDDLYHVDPTYSTAPTESATQIYNVRSADQTDRSANYNLRLGGAAAASADPVIVHAGTVNRACIDMVDDPGSGSWNFSITNLDSAPTLCTIDTNTTDFRCCVTDLPQTWSANANVLCSIAAVDTPDSNGGSTCDITFTEVR